MPEKPTAARLLLLVAVIAVPAAVLAEEATPLSLDEAEVVRRALERPGVEQQVQAHVDLARADEVAARRFPNPDLSWSREQVRGDSVRETQDVVALSQRFDLSGRRRLRGSAAEKRVGVAREEAELLRLEVATEARRVFVDALAQERRVEVVRAAVERLGGVSAAVVRRASAGDVAGYDRRRVERERAAMVARVEVETAALDRTRARLAALVGASTPIGLRGDIVPSDPPPLASLLERLPARPDLRALALEAESGDLESRAGGRGWIPEIEIGAGVKAVDAGAGTDTGFAAALVIPIPAFSRDQDARLRGDARARGARARLALALDEARADVTGLHAEATGLAEAARRYRGDAASDQGALLRTAEAAYRGGEAGVLEIVDAYRAALETELTAIDLAVAARRARIALDRSSGGASR